MWFFSHHCFCRGPRLTTLSFRNSELTLLKPGGPTRWFFRISLQTKTLARMKFSSASRWVFRGPVHYIFWAPIANEFTLACKTSVFPPHWTITPAVSVAMLIPYTECISLPMRPLPWKKIPTPQIWASLWKYLLYPQWLLTASAVFIFVSSLGSVMHWGPCQGLLALGFTLRIAIPFPMSP